MGGEPLLLTDLACRLGRMGSSARLALGPTVGAAWALVRFGPHPLALVDAERLPAALGPLPIAALRVSAAVCLNLRQVGIERVEHLSALPRENLLVRFGDALLRRLDQAFGRVREKIQPLRVSEVPACSPRLRRGDDPTGKPSRSPCGNCSRNCPNGSWKKRRGVRGLRLELKRINMPPLSRELVLGRPSRDARHLLVLLGPKVEGARPGRRRGGRVQRPSGPRRSGINKSACGMPGPKCTIRNMRPSSTHW